jgi:hypothetical protein
MNSYGLSIKIAGVGYLDGRVESDVHEIKSTAGHLFRKDPVISVCVFDRTDGKSHLYLKKNEDGTITREERK